MFKSRKKIAIAILKAQRDKLNKRETYTENNPWCNVTRDIIRKYIGKESQLYEESLKIDIHFWFGRYSKQDIALFISQNKDRAKNLIDGCIEHIEANGVYKEKSKTVISENWAIFLASTFVAIFLSTMPFVCQYGKNQAANEWQDEKRQLNKTIDSLSRYFPLRNRISDSIPTPKQK